MRAVYGDRVFAHVDMGRFDQPTTIARSDLKCRYYRALEDSRFLVGKVGISSIAVVVAEGLDL